MQAIVVNSSIRLEPVKFSHSFQIFQAIDSNRKFLEPWLPFVQQTRSQEDTEAFICSILAEKEKRRDDIYTIWYQGRFAGLIGLKETDYVNQKTEVGYWLTENMTGKGIVTNSLKVLIQFLFSTLKMNRIQIKCGVGNHHSSAIPKRLGFTFEGIERQGERHRDQFIDLEVYSLLMNDLRIF
ncbi:GNAT family N-acetyltransferase [Mangrovibacterium sp.]|uniref:GNAT family N-acetyltransferase n=1 Tax=Mangrovibacterium sp. TaxID=1961364 RepID=UPI00356AB183